MFNVLSNMFLLCIVCLNSRKKQWIFEILKRMAAILKIKNKK